MMDKSSLMIAVYSGYIGGTKKTIEYTRTKKINIKIINPLE